MNKQFASAAFALAASAALAAVPTVKEGSVTATQDSMSRLVTVNYTLEEAAGYVTVDVLTNGVSIGVENITHLAGDVNKLVEAGDRSFVWQPVKSWPGYKFTHGEVQFVVTAWDPAYPPDVLVIDLLMPNTVHYYESLAQLPGGVTNDIYKTDKLVLRKIPAENVTWRMGSPTTEPGQTDYSDFAHPVTLTKDYYMGVYEVTQMQWWHIMRPVTALKPSYFSNEDHWATRPVENVAYKGTSYGAYRDIRGNDSSWPDGADRHAVGDNSFFSRLRAHCGLQLLDLPTEAQWEFACRAGSGTAIYGHQDASDTALAKVARCRANSGYNCETELPSADSDLSVGTAAVGSYAPNDWGLYDMLGNVSEWTLGHFGQADTTPVVDPVGPSSGSLVHRGQAWTNDKNTMRCGSRLFYQYQNGSGQSPGGAGFLSDTWRADLGFRVCLHMVP